MSWIDKLATIGAATTGAVGLVSAILASRLSREGRNSLGEGLAGLFRGLLSMVTGKRRRP